MPNPSETDCDTAIRAEDNTPPVPVSSHQGVDDAQREPIGTAPAAYRVAANGWGVSGDTSGNVVLYLGGLPGSTASKLALTIDRDLAAKIRDGIDAVLEAYAVPTDAPTAPDLDAIEARLAASTPGPWSVGTQEPHGYSVHAATNPCDFDASNRVAQVDCLGDAEAIAHAFTADLRALVVRVRAADDDMVGVTTTMEHATANLCALTAWVRELEAECARLRAVVPT